MRESERLPMNRKNKNKKLNDSERAELEYLREQNKRYEILMSYEKKLNTLIQEDQKNKKL